MLQRKELLLLIFSALLTVVLSIGLIRWLAPGLLGVPADLQLVQTDQRVPPFFENVFRIDDIKSDEFILQDPHVKRAKPLVPDVGFFGPNDLLGFRNRSVPIHPKIIVIGDSQTYGNNAALEQNWPSVLARRLGLSSLDIYNMATGGWSAIDYLYIADKAFAFRPKALVVAFYVGNDPLEAFIEAYGNPIWSEFRVDPGLKPGDAPKITFPAPPEEVWRTRLANGEAMALTPTLRHANTVPGPVVDAGWEIMARVAERLAAICAKTNTELILTLIPTKEYAMRGAIGAEGVGPPAEYERLIEDEAVRIQTFAERLSTLQHGRYVDVTAALEEAATSTPDLYPADTDGHPLAAGYQVIGEAIAPHLSASRFVTPTGVYAVGPSSDEIHQLRLMTDQGWWLFETIDAVIAYTEVSEVLPAQEIHLAQAGEFASAPFLGVITADGTRHPILESRPTRPIQSGSRSLR